MARPAKLSTEVIGATYAPPGPTGPVGDQPPGLAGPETGEPFGPSVQGAVNTYVYAVGRILPYHLTRAKANARAIRQAVR